MKLRTFVATMIFGVLSLSAGAQTSFPMLGSVYPTGVERGKTTIVTVRGGGNGGANLYGAYKAVFEGPGIQTEILPPDKGWPAKDPKTPWALPNVGEVRMKVAVAPDAPLGIREFRIATQRAGISTIGQLVIGDEPETVETEPNNDPEHAQAVAIPGVVDGVFQSGEDVDCFKFKVAAGQEVTFTALCARLEDKVHDLQEHADPLLVVRDAKGVEIARNDDYYRADPLLHVKFEKAGEYSVQIRDVSYKGNGHWVYRLTMTSRPYVTAVVPCAVRPGQSNELHLYGYGLSAETVRLDVPADAPRGIWQTQVKLPNGVSNLISVLVTDAPQRVAEPTPGKVAGGAGAKLASDARRPAPNAPTPFALPGGVNSWISTPGQPDRYKFHAKKGEAWGFEVTSRRLDSMMDSELKLRDGKGNVLAANDDTFGKDSRIDWTAGEEGDYILEVRDLANHAGPTYFYNVTAHPLRPDFRLKCDTDRAMIAPGNRTTWYAQVERRYGLAGEIKVELKGLPPGIATMPVTIPANMDTGTIFLTAAPDAKFDASLVEVIGSATVKGLDGKETTIQHVAHPVTEIYVPGGGRGLLEARTQGVAISETNDLEVTTNVQQVTLAPGGEAKIEVTIKRRPDYTKPVTLDIRVQHLGGIFVNPLPPGVTIDDTTIPENQTKGTITLRASADAPPISNLPIAVFANASINFVMKVWYSAAPISLTVTPKK